MSSWEDEMIPLAPGPAPQASAAPPMTFDEMIAAQPAPTREVTRLRRDSFTGIPGQAPIPRTETVPNYPKGVGERVLAGAHDLGNTVADTATFGLADRAQAAATGDPLEEVRARTAASRARDPGQAAVGDVVTALATARAVPSLMGIEAGLPVRAGLAGAEAGAYGAANAVGHSQFPLLDQRNLAVAKDAAKGPAMVGAALPVAGQMFSSGARLAKDVLARSSDSVLARQIHPRDIDAMERLGPEAMLLDAGHGGRSFGQGLVGAGGEAADDVVRALAERAAGRDTRLRAGLNEDFGPNVDPSRFKNTVERNIGRAAGEMYPAAAREAAPITGFGAAIDDVAERANSLSASGRTSAQRWIDDLRDAHNAETPALQAKRLHDIRKRLDKSISKDTTGLSSAERADQHLLKDIRGTVDGLVKSVPGFAQADARVAAMNKSIEGVDFGYDNVAGGGGPSAMSPEAFMDAMNTNQRTAMQIGARGRMENAVGTSTNDASALRQMFGTSSEDWGRRKLQTAFGETHPGAVDRTVERIENEARMSQRGVDIAGGSQTAQRMGAAKVIGDREPFALPPLAEMPTAAINAITRAITGKLLNRGSEDFRQGLSRVLTAQGAERDRAVQGLREAARQNTEAGRAARDALSSPLMLRLLGASSEQ